VNLRAYFREVLMSLELVEEAIIAFLASQLIQPTAILWPQDLHNSGMSIRLSRRQGNRGRDAYPPEAVFHWAASFVSTKKPTTPPMLGARMRT
jgi:hypothetical protein